MKLRVMEYDGEMVLAVAGARQTLIIREEEGGFTFEMLGEGRQAVPVFTLESAREEDATADTTAEDVAAEEPPPDNGLFNRLSVLRKELAATDAVPPYMIFHNKTLQAMVDAMPRDMRAFGAISGVGQAKCDKYGPAFLAVINGYCPARGAAETPFSS